MESIQGVLDAVGSSLSQISSKHVGVAVAVAITAVQLKWYLDYRAFKRIYGKADIRPAFGPMTAPGMLFGMASMWHWDGRFTNYKNTNKGIISVVPTAWGEPYFYTNSIEVMRQIGGGGHSNTWIKPEWQGVTTRYWGNGILAVNYLEWRTHRRVMQPAFNSKLYELVWSEATRLYNEMLVTEKYPTRSGETISFEHFLNITHRLALCVILSCGFGLPLKWTEKHYADKEHSTVSVDDGIKVQGDNLILVVFGPKWVLRLPFEKLRKIKDATDAMRTWFRNSIASKKRDIAQILQETGGDVDSVSQDVFSRLALANLRGDKHQLGDSEVIGNTWALFFAGHDTTASSIAATLGHLAANPREQDIVYEEITQVTKDAGGQLTFEHLDSLVKTRAAFIEGTRLFPAGHLLIRECTEDTVLQVPTVGKDGKVYDSSMPFKKGAIIVGDMIAMQYNQRAFPSPEKFDPSRWYNVASDDAFTVFSVGPRVCIGRKFAITESVAFISNLLRDYIVEPLLKDGEDLEQWKERVLGRAEIKLTLSIADMPLKLRRR